MENILLDLKKLQSFLQKAGKLWESETFSQSRKIGGELWCWLELNLWMDRTENKLQNLSSNSSASSQSILDTNKYVHPPETWPKRGAEVSTDGAT